MGLHYFKKDPCDTEQVDRFQVALIMCGLQKRPQLQHAPYDHMVAKNLKHNFVETWILCTRNVDPCFGSTTDKTDCQTGTRGYNLVLNTNFNLDILSLYGDIAIDELHCKLYTSWGISNSCSCDVVQGTTKELLHKRSSTKQSNCRLR